MLCPKCNNDTKVIDSRADGWIVRRRRECLVCGFRFATSELATQPMHDEDPRRGLSKKLTSVIGAIQDAQEVLSELSELKVVVDKEATP